MRFLLAVLNTSPRLTASNDWGLYAATVGIALEAKLSRLPRTQGAIPSEIGSRIRIAARQSGIPRAGNAVTARILPTRRPTGFGAGAGIGHANDTREPCAPGVADDISTTQPRRIGHTAGCPARGWSRAGCNT